MRLYFLLILSLSFSTLARSADWKLESETDGIKVLSRKDPGSPVVNFRGEGIVRYPMQRIYDALSDIEKYSLWMPLVRSSKILQNFSPVKKIVMIHIGMPWPVRDRYFVNLGEVSRDPSGTETLEIKSIQSEYRDETRVEGWTTRSFFSIRPTDKPDHTYMVVELNQDPRGSIPKWMVNWVQSSWPKEFFENLNAHLATPGVKVND